MIRYAILYFIMFIIFVVLIIGPVIARNYIGNLGDNLPLHLMQPTGQNNNDTLGSQKTGSFINGFVSSGPTASSNGDSGGDSSSSTDNPFAGLTGRAVLPTAMALAF